MGSPRAVAVPRARHLDAGDERPGASGGAVQARVQEWEKKKTAEIQAKVKEAEGIQAKLNQGGTVLNDAARTQA